MLQLRHTACDPELGASVTQAEIRADDLIVLHSRHEGGVNDEAMERAVTSAGPGWSMVRFVIEGPLLAGPGARGVVVEGGEAFASTDWATAPSRSLTTVCEEIRFIWRAGGRGGVANPHDGVLRFSLAGRDAFHRLAHEMKGRDPVAVRRAVRQVALSLRAAGVPLDPEARIADAPLASHDFAGALERVLLPMSSQPMALDLARALGIGERQALRRASDHLRRFHVSVVSWREYILGMRVALGAFLMSQRRARTEHVSRLLGFGSPTSFCHAFHDAGLPSPLELQRRLLKT